MRGFVSRTSLAVVQQTASLLPKCGSCGLWERGCRSPKMEPYGKGKRRVLIVGEAPGKNEDEQGRQFVGKAGRHLWRTLERLGIDRDDCWTDNALRCWPHEGERNRTPTPKEISFCQPNLEKSIRELKPDVVLLLGSIPIQSFLSPRFPSPMSGGGMGRWTGWKIPCRSPNAWVCPTWHPSYLLREENKPNGQVLQREWERHLKAAFRLKGKPYASPEDIPNHLDEVEVEMDPESAWTRIDAFRLEGKPIAFDFECEGLKPDRKDLLLWSCAVSDGRTTVAYPWQGKAIEATKELLESKVSKIGWNLKYEHRWAKARLGIDVRNWIHDGMLATHVLDNRPGITSLDFQSFVLLGQQPWDRAVGPLLKSKTRGGNERNRIREADLKQVLEYNGLDALLTFKLAEVQRRIMGVKL